MLKIAVSQHNIDYAFLQSSTDFMLHIYTELCARKQNVVGNHQCMFFVAGFVRVVHSMREI